jgi:hypothetical protein
MAARAFLDISVNPVHAATIDERKKGDRRMPDGLLRKSI